MISAVMSTIGGRFVLDALDSMPMFSECLVVVDMVGRAASDLETTYPLGDLERDVVARGAQVVRYEPAPAQWAVHNGSYNLGARLAKHPWILFAHDDVTWPNKHHVVLEATIPRVAELSHTYGRRIVGIEFPCWEQNAVMVPEFPTGTLALTQGMQPAAFLLEKAALEEIGGFDEAGVWYDGQLEHEMILRNWWWLHLPLPPVHHQSNRTYQINNWGGGWKANPVWASHPENFQRKYGVPPAPRRLSLAEAIVLDARGDLE
jgi:hypothetical protein